jgi:hypothetical protein
MKKVDNAFFSYLTMLLPADHYVISESVGYHKCGTRRNVIRSNFNICFTVHFYNSILITPTNAQTNI